MASIIFERSNDALLVNPPSGDQYLAVNGSNWLWAVTAVFTVSFLAFFLLAFKARSNERIFHYIFAAALFTGAVAYFAQASDLAWTVIKQADGIDIYGLTRQIFFAKYVYWVVSFPVVNIALGLLSGIPWATIFYHVFLSWAWVLSYLFSAYTTTNYKWGFYAFGTAAYFLLVIGTFTDGLRGARRVESTRDYLLLAGWTNLLWLLYPVAFGLSDGGNRITVTSGFVFFGILDVLMVPVLAFAVLVLSRRWDYGRLNLNFTQYGRVHQESGHFPEKHHAPHHTPANTAANTTTAAPGGVVEGNVV